MRRPFFPQARTRAQRLGRCAAIRGLVLKYGQQQPKTVRSDPRRANEPRMPRNRRLPPIPGTGLPPRGLFVARWKALLPTRGPELLPRLDTAALAPEALAQLFRAAQQGWQIYLIGNEPGVASGRVSDERWEDFRLELEVLLAAQGIPLQRHYACLEDPHGKGKHRRDSVFRFPNTGVLYHAAQEDGIELAESWLVSADTDELAAAWRAGVRTLALEWQGRSAAQDSELQVEPALRGPDLARGLRALLALDPLARI
jgi:histidinol phosphatase-like enzyme